MDKISPCLWFDGNAEEAANFYVSVFKDSKINEVARWGEGGPYPKGTALVVAVELQGEQYQALNGGTDIPFTDAISLSIRCEDQAEVDYFWDKLTADGGEPGRCGWLGPEAADGCGAGVPARRWGRGRARWTPRCCLCGSPVDRLRAR